MALAANTKRDHRETASLILEPPVAANAVIYQGSAVCYNSAGYLVVASATAGLSAALGIAIEDANATGLANGAIAAWARCTRRPTACWPGGRR